MSACIRVLLVTKSTGGVAEYIRWVLDGIDHRQFQVTVACLSEDSASFAEELRAHYGVETFHFDMNRYRIDPISDARVGFHLIKLMRSRSFDVVHAHASKPGFLTRMAALGTGVPVLYSPHCFAFHAGAGRVTRTITSSLERLAAHFTTRIVVVSDGERELARSYRVGRDDQFTVIHTGIDPSRYRQSTENDSLKSSLGIPLSSPVVGSIGRLSRQKSPLDFVRMAEAVHRSQPEAHFIWVGDGPLKSDARELSRSLHLEQVIHWLGQRSDVPHWLQVMDCLVLTSLWEGFPLVVLEAMASGTPVVATDVLGTRELILHGRNGYVAPAGEPVLMARFVLDLLSDPVTKSRFAAASHERINREFTRDRMISKLQGIYLETTLQRGARHG